MQKIIDKVIWFAFTHKLVPNATPCYNLIYFPGKVIVSFRPWFFGYYYGPDCGYKHCITAGYFTIWY